MARTVVTPQLPPSHNRLALIRWSSERYVRFKSVLILPVGDWEFRGRIVCSHHGKSAEVKEHDVCLWHHWEKGI
jgi:hypothetical protein